jgi:CRISPR-associated endonuclease/helicase Cas3
MPGIGRVAKERYLEYCKCAGFEPREGIVKLFEAIDEVVDSGGIVIARMPTGYGKTMSTVFLATAVKVVGIEEGVARVIHVLPMRSLVRDALNRALRLVGSRGGYGEEARLREKCLHKESCCKDVHVGEAEGCGHVFRPLGPSDIAYQASIYESEASKDQLFLSTLVYTTLDSYILNFTKITPLRSRYASYQAARAAIYRSITVFDEAHLFTEVDATKAYTALITVARSLVEARLPVVFVTATASDSLITKIATDIGVDRSRCVAVSVEEKREGEEVAMCRTIIVSDPVKEPTIATHIIDDIGSEEDVYARVADKVKSLLRKREEGWRVPRILIVRNTVSRAIATYHRLVQELRDLLSSTAPVLIHGRLTHGDRKSAEESLRESNIIVSTQVIEAGVDLDVDVLITDPAPLAQLIQRVGRVCRHGDSGRKCEAHIVYPKSRDLLHKLVEGVYDEGLTESSLGAIERVKKVFGYISWRKSSRYDDRSYLKLLNEVYGHDYTSKLSIDNDVREALENIDLVITLHRKDAERISEELCSFVRDSVEVPLIVVPGIGERSMRDVKEELNNRFSECIKMCTGSEDKYSSKCVAHCEREVIIHNTVNVSHTYLYSMYKKLERPAGIIRYALVLAVERGRVVKPRLLLLDMESDVEKILSAKDSTHLCREFYRLERRVLRNAISKINDFEDDASASVSFLGLAIPASLYRSGYGLATDFEV